jgi:hypothetical protein
MTVVMRLALQVSALQVEQAGMAALSAGRLRFLLPFPVASGRCCACLSIGMYISCQPS